MKEIEERSDEVSILVLMEVLREEDAAANYADGGVVFQSLF